jgi:hypothetical protein
MSLSACEMMLVLRNNDFGLLVVLLDPCRTSSDFANVQIFSPSSCSNFQQMYRTYNRKTELSAKWANFQLMQAGAINNGLGDAQPKLLKSNGSAGASKIGPDSTRILCMYCTGTTIKITATNL